MHPYFIYDRSLRSRFLFRIPSYFRSFLATLFFLKAVTPAPDRVETPHNLSWFDDPEFAQAYSDAVSLVGVDYRIPWRIQNILWGLSATVNINGDVVELGTGRGFAMATAASWLHRNRDIRKIHLFDVFQKAQVSGHGDKKHDKYYASSIADTQKVFKTFSNVFFYEGDVLRTCYNLKASSISLLHVDLNNPSLELKVFEILKPRIAKGCIIILDDYSQKGHESGRQLQYNFFSNLGLVILSTPSGQGIIIWK